MKRQILCKRCGSETNGRFPNKNPYPGEHVKFIDGQALFDEMVCDYCDSPIAVGEECTAFSIWSDYSGRPYYKWEHEFIKVKEAYKIGALVEVNAAKAAKSLMPMFMPDLLEIKEAE